MNWIYEHKQYEPSDDELKKYKGFVYRITHNDTKQFYIGQKVFWNKIRRPATKKKKKRIETKQSDWMKYNSSSDTLKALIKAQPNDYTKEILFLAINKAEMNYVETFLQMKYKVLLTDKSYNGMINIRQGSKGLERLINHKILN